MKTSKTMALRARDRFLQESSFFYSMKGIRAEKLLTKPGNVSFMKKSNPSLSVPENLIWCFIDISSLTPSWTSQAVFHCSILKLIKIFQVSKCLLSSKLRKMSLVTSMIISLINHCADKLEYTSYNVSLEKVGLNLASVSSTGSKGRTLS